MMNIHGKEISRRGFLSASAAVAGCSALALGLESCGIGSLLYSSGDIPVSVGRAEIDLKNEPALQTTGGAVKKRFASLNDGAVVIIVRTGESAFEAFTAQCTHWGAEVLPPKDGVLVCPFHGSRFSTKDGSVLEGPAKSPLSVFHIEWDQTREKLFLTP